MYLVKRWDNVILDRSLELRKAETMAIVASGSTCYGHRVDVTEYSDTRPETTVRMYLNGIEV